MGLNRIAAGAALLLFFFYAALVAPLLYWAGPSALAGDFSAPRLLFSLRLSLVAALAATGLSMAIALPAGYALSRRDFPGRALVDLLLELPLVVSPVALGAALLVLLATPAGRLVEARVGFVYTALGIVLAQFAATAGLATRLAKAAFDAVPPRYEAVAASLGARPARVFRTVTLPLARRGLLAAAVLTFAKCIGEFGATVMLAGAMPMRTETLPVSIFLRLSSADVGGAAALILVLLALGLAVTAASRLLAGGRP